VNWNAGLRTGPVHEVVLVMNKIISAITLSIVAASGCTESESLSSNQGVSFEEFKTKMYLEPWAGGKYIVGGDEAVDEAGLKEIWEATQQGALAIVSHGGVDLRWAGGSERRLTYCVSDAFGIRKSAVVGALNLAAEYGWERMANVDFIYEPEQDANCNETNTDVVFNVSPISGQPYWARAFFPTGNRAERTVYIDDKAFTTNPYPLSNIMGHELGHILSFRHEHVRPEANAAQCRANDGDVDGFRGLTAYDAASIMHYPDCNGTGAFTFTQLDSAGAVSVYGPPAGAVNLPMAVINSPSPGETVASDFIVSASVIGDNITKVEVFVDGESKGVKDTGPFDFAITGIEAGDHTVDLVASGEGVSAQSSINIVVVGSIASGGDGGGDLLGGCNAAGNAGPGGVLLALMATMFNRRRRSA
jgi:Bacterial Ig domain